MSLADEELSSVLKGNIAPFKDEELSTRVEVMKRRLNSRCKGLLEVASELEHPDDVLHLSRDPEKRSLPTSTVQYLHKTVKDFLENSKNWEWLIKSRQEDYDPNLALAKSFLGQLKGIALSPLRSGKFVSAVEMCLFYARLAQNGRQADLVAVLDELDCTAGECARRFHNSDQIVRDGILATDQDWFQKFLGQKSCELERHWTWTCDIYTAASITPWFPQGLNFLSLATRLGLHEYVAAKIKQGCLVVQDGNTCPLLLDAIRPLESNKLPALPKPFPDKRMVKLLLEHGADPNRAIPFSSGNMTPWEYLLWEAQDNTWSDLDPWLEIVPLFLAYGADPCGITNSCFRFPDYRTPGISDNTLREPTYQVGDALYTYLRLTNEWFNWGLSLWPRCHFSATDIDIIKKRVAKRLQ